jgi:hypothetical protein
MRKKMESNEEGEGKRGLLPDGLDLEGLRLRKCFTDLKCRV